MLKWYNKYDLFQDKCKYSMFDISCQRFWIIITKILVRHIHKMTVISDEHIGNLQSSMQFLPTRLPVIVWQRVEEQFPACRVTMVTAVCLCADKRITSYYSEDLYGSKKKCFLGILCSLSFSVVLDFKGDFLYLYSWMYFIVLLAHAW